MRRLVFGLLLLLAVVVGTFAGLRASVTFSHTRQMPPPVPDRLAFTPFPSPAPLPTGRAAAWAGTPSYATPSPGVAATPAPSPEASRSSRQRRIVAQRDERQARRHTNRNIQGTARWHATGRDGWYAAAGCALRKAIGPDWRGTRVIVENQRGGGWIGVTLNDVIGRLRNGRCSRTLIDLSDEAFAELAPLSRGTLRVAVGY